MTTRIQRFDSVTSTNDTAKELLAEGAQSGTIVVAQTQTEGRGRSGRTWFSPDEDNLYLSMIHQSALDPEHIAGLTLDVAVAVAEALVTCGFEPELRWPNDILINGRKVGGILCELELKPCLAVIVGIGLNINGQDFPPEIEGIATSLLLAGHEPIETSSVERALIARLTDQVTRYERAGAPDIDTYLRYFRSIGRPVNLPSGEMGKVRGITDEGGLQVDVDGELRVMRSGEVTLR